MMRRVLLGFGALVALCAPAAAMAEDWVSLGEFNTSANFSYDRDSIALKDGVAFFWVKTDYRGFDNPDVDPEEAENRTHEQLDCRGKRIRLMEFVSYDKSGAELERYSWNDEEAEWLPIDEGSLADEKRTQICPGA